MKDGLIRVAAATPPTKVADVAYNSLEIEKLIRQAAEDGCALIVFPELSVTACTCGDLFRDMLLLAKAEEGLRMLVERTKVLDILCVAGVPVPWNGRLYNCGAVFHKGVLLGLSAKGFISNDSAFYEMRYFTKGMPCAEIDYCGQHTHIGTQLLYACENVEALTIGVELCEDLWTPVPPSVRLAQNGATVILNLSCSEELVGRAERRRDLVKTHAGKILAGYVYAGSGMGESTTDMVFAGQNLIAEHGSILAESQLFTYGLLTADLDLQRLRQERLRTDTWREETPQGFAKIPYAYAAGTVQAFVPRRRFSKLPFVPGEAGELWTRCGRILQMQAAGLATRLQHIGGETAILGLSGGLDSTLALLVTTRAFSILNLDNAGILAVSMPCFGTTGRTMKNAEKIARELGVSFLEIPIHKAVEQHFKDIGQEMGNQDVTFENAQARERTQVLMDLANQRGGIVIGTGDLSELALGWATYNGDHMSMYAVNASVPKTLVRHLVGYAAAQSGEALKAALQDVLDTPVSPELLPPKAGEISQKTEELVGPYELHDFFLYYMLRFGLPPGKIYRMACSAFAGEYTPDVIKKWLAVFYRRFFAQQFKRSCLPDGPKIGSVGLSPRGDFRMPSDACAATWLSEIAAL